MKRTVITFIIIACSNLISAQTEVQINTSKSKIKWNIRYGSKDRVSVKDYAISDAIEFEVELYF